MTNSPLILNLDCDMYANNPQVFIHAMCMLFSFKNEEDAGFIQFPQAFYNGLKDDPFGNQLANFYVCIFFLISYSLDLIWHDMTGCTVFDMNTSPIISCHVTNKWHPKYKFKNPTWFYHFNLFFMFTSVSCKWNFGNSRDFLRRIKLFSQTKGYLWFISKW